MESPQHPLELATQGDPNAIATLINNALRSKKITARVTRQANSLRVLLESEQVPDQESLAPYLQQNLAKLGLTTVETVELIGKQSCAALPAWRQTVSLHDRSPGSAAPKSVLPTPSKSSGPLPAAATTSATLAPNVKPLSQPSQASQTAKSRQVRSQQAYQIAFSGIIALTLILVGANLKSVHTLFAKPTKPPSRATLAPTKSGIYRAEIIRRLGGVPVIMVTFNGRYNYPMIVDTGAAGTLITRPMAQSLGVSVASQATAQTANGYVTLDVGYVTSIEVDGAKIERVPVAIGLPDMDVGLLGHDFFGDFDVTVREKVVEFSPRETSSAPATGETAGKSG